jgi:hypothetical protein
MRRKLWIATALAAAFLLNGCGGGAFFYDEPVETYYLQSYDDVTGRYEGVANVYYECGRDIVNYTDSRGAFNLYEGDTCTFYDLDDTVSYEYDRLYISTTPTGSHSAGEIPYDCASGWSGVTNANSMFIFDPDYFNNVSDGDICRLYL